MTKKQRFGGRHSREQRFAGVSGWRMAGVSGGVLLSILLAGCNTPPPPDPRTACAITAGDATVAVNLTADDCTKVQAAFAAQKTAADAQTVSEDERQDAIKKYRAEITARIHKDQLAGYRKTSVDDFKLYGQELTQSDAKVAVQGVYVKTNRGEFLMPSTQAASQVEATQTPDEGINLVSKGANKSTKQSFGQCQKDAVGARLGCPITVLGKAVMCPRTTMFGVAEAPCIAVDDSWYIAPPS